MDRIVAYLPLLVFFSFQSIVFTIYWNDFSLFKQSFALFSGDQTENPPLISVVSSVKSYKCYPLKGKTFFFLSVALPPSWAVVPCALGKVLL